MRRGPGASYDVGMGRWATVHDTSRTALVEASSPKKLVTVSARLRADRDGGE